MIERVLDELRCELGRAGVTGRSAARPLAEARDHLLEGARAEGEEAAVAAFGSPHCMATVVARWRAEGDPGSGLAGGALETVAFLGCYFALRRPLARGGLRAKAGPPS